jgi:uncharacterized iron-regulated membrane protein
MKTSIDRQWPSYRTVWRWHFFAGLFCIPFVIFLSITGTIYLFKPQFDAWSQRSHDSLATPDKHQPLSEQVQAALVGVPDAKSLEVELPRLATGATTVIVKDTKGTWRVLVHPQRLTILDIKNENESLMKQVKSLHGQLGIGTWGSYLVEIAACWTIVMILTGLVLWWPKNAKGLGGVLYPRWDKGDRVWWRDLHSVLGVWISVLAIFLILTGLPWAKFWGNYFRTVRQTVGLAATSQDWTIGGKSQSAPSEHAGHSHDEKPKIARRGGRSSGAPIPKDLSGFDQLHQVAKLEMLAHPVLLIPPESQGAYWKITSDAQNRTLRETLLVDVSDGTIALREVFSQKHWIDKVVGIGIAAHEGQLFGIANQILGVLTTAGLIALSCSGVWMWWRRREAGTLGIPAPLSQERLVWSVWLGILMLGIAMPLFGATLVGVLMVDRLRC